MKKIAVFVDIQNIYYTVKQSFDSHFNYANFWKKIESRGEITTAIAYAIDRKDKKQIQFQQTLADIGFEIKLKPFIQRRDGTAKGDWDVGITIDILDIAPHVDNVVLASGDGDFAILIEKIKRDYNVFVEVYGVPALTSELLIKAATLYHPIDNSLILPLNR